MEDILGERRGMGMMTVGKGNRLRIVAFTQIWG